MFSSVYGYQKNTFWIKTFFNRKNKKLVFKERMFFSHQESDIDDVEYEEGSDVRHSGCLRLFLSQHSKVSRDSGKARPFNYNTLNPSQCAKDCGPC